MRPEPFHGHRWTDKETLTLDIPIRILFLAADPSDQTRTRVAGEFQTIREALARGRYRESFDLRPEFSVKVADLTRAAGELRPHILQFSGHGTPTGGLCFELETTRARRVELADLAGFFARLAPELHCVVLNSCYSAKQAGKVAKHVPYVIAFKEVVTEEAANLVSLELYQALAAGRTIEDAFADACAALQAHGLPSTVKPVMKKKRGATMPPARLLETGAHLRGESSGKGNLTMRRTRSARHTRGTARGDIDADDVVAGCDLTLEAGKP